MDKNDPLVRLLVDENEEFRSLYRQHLDLEKKLANIDSIHYLTPQEELERKSIQKMKLMGKDRMEAIISQVKKVTVRT